MMPPDCARIDLATLDDYSAGTLPDGDSSALEEHLFACAACAARAADHEALLRAIDAAARTAAFGGVLTDAVLNQLSRDGVRVRTFALAPGDVVPCAVWEDDQLLALRLRADFAGLSQVTLTQHVGGREVVRATTEVPPAATEVVFATPAAWVRELPVVQVDVALRAVDADGERVIARYTLEHGGSLRH